MHILNFQNDHVVNSLIVMSESDLCNSLKTINILLRRGVLVMHTLVVLCTHI